MRLAEPKRTARPSGSVKTTKAVVSILAAAFVSLSAGCSPSTTTQQQEVKTQAEQPAPSPSQQLALLHWAPANHKAIQALIDDYGVRSKSYNKDKRPYAVFDWDNTSAFNDVEETLLTYQLTNLQCKMTPEQFVSAIKKNIPKDNFKKEFNNKAGKPVQIDLISEDLGADYKYLYENYKGFKGTKSLEEIKATPQYQDFVAKARYLYEAIGGTFSPDVSYPWVTYLFSGMTEKEVRQLAGASIDYNLQDAIGEKTLTSPGELPGQAGVVEVKIKTGLRAFAEQQNLYKTFMDNGIDVYICSASFVDVVKEFASNPKYGYSLPEDHVLAMELERDAAGVIQPEYRKGYDQTQGKGKTKTIERFLVSKYGHGPLFVAGDSDGDTAMLTDFKDMRLGLIVNRLKGGELGELSKTAANGIGTGNAKYLLQGRDDNTGAFRNSEKSVSLGSSEEKLLK
ncbi:phosphoserine phosphatase [Paenibacillus elgii]|uniref:phosphoserine phosphatase n=1 Tax=Paenibacillus elgii TaxID=189691 RepID=A0A161SH83_9BACL|nr:haloacid dehalogenase-like hydrolase [Paenibacillus elgii]KZE80775.1 phosphoserine phosphatase [Paenibacillus elgii]